MKLLPACLIISCVLGFNAYGQTCEILVTKRPFKIKLERTVSSATARESDYVLFTTLENIYSTREGNCPAVLFPAGTNIFGTVTRRKHRKFPFRKGELEVKLEPLKIWNGETVSLEIQRRQPPPANDPPKNCKEGNHKCLAGRKNPAVAPVVASIATAGSSVIAGVADDKTTRIIAWSGLFTLISQGGIAELLNGTDAVLEVGEVFDLEIGEGVKVTPVPKDPEKTKEPGKDKSN
jgi:hypothetical protein